MGDKIDFPYNDKLYFKKATDYFKNNQFEKASYLIKKMYKKNNSFDNNYFYTLTLTELKKYQKAMDIANEYKDEYIKNEKFRLLYAFLLIKTRQFIQADHLIHNIANETQRYQSEWKKLEKVIIKEKEIVENESKQRINETRNKLMNMYNYSLIEQAGIIGEAYLLELSDLQKMGQFIFSSPNFTGQIQRSFLEVLISKKDPTEYTFPWFNKQIKIIPRELKKFNEFFLIKNIDYMLSEKLHKSPSLIDIIKNEIINDLLILYPLIDEIITDTDFWINQYIMFFDDKNESDLSNKVSLSEQKEMKEWLEKLHTFAQRNIF